MLHTTVVQERPVRRDTDSHINKAFLPRFNSAASAEHPNGTPGWQEDHKPYVSLHTHWCEFTLHLTTRICVSSPSFSNTFSSGTETKTTSFGPTTHTKALEISASTLFLVLLPLSSSTYAFPFLRGRSSVFLSPVSVANDGSLTGLVTL